MITFQLTHDQSWRNSLNRNGFGDFIDAQGRRILITHGEPDGDLPCLHNKDAKQLARPDIIICCFPQQVQARWPMITVAGDWAEETKPIVKNDRLFIMSRTEAVQLGLA